MLFFPLLLESSAVAGICRSPIVHPREWIANSFKGDATKRCIVKFSIDEHTWSDERKFFAMRIYVSNESRTMRHPLHHSTEDKLYFDFLHFIDWGVFLIWFIRMNNCVANFFFHLVVSLLDAIEVFVELLNWLIVMIGLIIFRLEFFYFSFIF